MSTKVSSSTLKSRKGSVGFIKAAVTALPGWGGLSGGVASNAGIRGAAAGKSAAWPIAQWSMDLFHIFAIFSALFTARYLVWRWTETINWQAAWYSLPLATAETVSALALFLYFYSLWQDKEVEQPKAAAGIKALAAEASTDLAPDQNADQTQVIDIYITTYNESAEILARTLAAAKQVQAPLGATTDIYLLDDGRRAEIKALADSFGVGYLDRETNEGFKAGNLCAALPRTQGSLIVICDADTELFPNFLSQTTGYFKDPDVAWVQTPHWSHDIPEGRELSQIIEARVPRWLAAPINAVLNLFGPIKIGQDPLVNDNRFFFEVIQKRRNAANASFCCGAASIHRRSALLQNIKQNLSEKTITRSADGEVTAFNNHVSEDIFTSIRLHADPKTNWRSVLHAEVVSQQMSPQDLLSRFIQLFKYSGGSLDIFINNRILTCKGLSLQQRLMYLSTFVGYLSCLYMIIYFIAPPIYLMTGIAPIKISDNSFLLYFGPSAIFNELALIFASSGLAGWKARAWNIGLFWVHIKSLVTVLRGKQIKFVVTPKTKTQGTFTSLVWANWLVLALNLGSLAFALVAWQLGLIDYQPSALVLVGFFAIVNALLMLPVLRAAYWRG